MAASYRKGFNLMRSKRFVSILTILWMVSFVSLAFSGGAFGASVDSYTFQVNSSAGNVAFINESDDQVGLVDSDKKIMVQKVNENDDTENDNINDARYFYDLIPGETRVPLQHGSGNYEIVLLSHSSGNSYSVVDRINVEVELENKLLPFLNSTWPVYWDEDSKATELAAELVEGITEDSKKIETIYNYIVENIAYDYDKINNIDSFYVPDIDVVLESKTGICYDYSVLFAGMLRSVDIPTKLV